MAISFAVTWDYRCPFARNAHEHVLTALAAGADWRVQFLPFSLGQAHVEQGQPSVWEKPEQDKGILALQAGIVVRDEFPDRFAAAHRALFAVRHDHGLHLEDRDLIAKTLIDNGVNAGAVFQRIDSGAALEAVRAEHEQYLASHNVWGVPTFIAGDEAVFVRLMNRPNDESADSVKAIERIIDLLTGWTDLNEFKHTSIRR